MKRSHLVLLSVYLYNERRGYTQLRRLRDAFESLHPEESEMIAAIEKHAADERKHYLMFRRLFSLSGERPFEVGRGVGYVDRFLMTAFGKTADEMSLLEIAADPTTLHRLFRVIMMTEARGLRQVRWLRSTSWIRSHPRIDGVFAVIERDEPSHCAPYQSWLERRKAHAPGLREYMEDLWIHLSLTWIRIPLLYLNFRAPRVKD